MKSTSGNLSQKEFHEKIALSLKELATISDRVCLGDKKMTMRGISGVVGMHIS